MTEPPRRPKNSYFRQGLGREEERELWSMEQLKRKACLVAFMLRTFRKLEGTYGYPHVGDVIESQLLHLLAVALG